MTRHLKDHWYIAVALIAIFAAGNGFGYVFGSKSARSASPPETVAPATWAESSLDQLENSLDLTPEQLEAIRPKVEATAAKVIAARERTLLDYHVLLLALHDDLENHLDPGQRTRLDQSKSGLEETIRNRFSGLLNDSN